MNILFWLFLIFDLLTCIVLLIAGDFRRSFTGNNPMGWVAILMLCCVVAGPVARFVFKRLMAGLVLVTAPVAALLVWYLLDKLKET